MTHHIASSVDALSGVNVLVVEDEFLIALEAQRIFLDAGAAGVVMANSVSKAREALEQGVPFSIGLLDLKLGEEDALPLVADLRDRGIPILIITGLDNDPSGLDGTSVIRKPYREADVLCAARVLLGPRT